MQATETLKTTISQMILEVMPTLQADMLSDDVDIFSLGLDSINSVRLILALQSEFGINFSTHEINPDNFRTIQKISDLVYQKQI